MISEVVCASQMRCLLPPLQEAPALPRSHASLPMSISPCPSPYVHHPMTIAACPSPHAHHPVPITPCPSPHAPLPMPITPCPSPRAHHLAPTPTAWSGLAQRSVAPGSSFKDTFISPSFQIHQFWPIYFVLEGEISL